VKDDFWKVDKSKNEDIEKAVEIDIRRVKDIMDEVIWDNDMYYRMEIDTHRCVVVLISEYYGTYFTIVFRQHEHGRILVGNVGSLLEIEFDSEWEPEAIADAIDEQFIS